jgi:hypothetical protein
VKLGLEAKHVGFRLLNSDIIEFRTMYVFFWARDKEGVRAGEEGGKEGRERRGGRGEREEGLTPVKS